MKTVFSRILPIGVFALALVLGGCSKEPVKIESVEVLTNVDRGSGNFNRVLKICFDQPLKSSFYHTVTLITNEDYKLEGGNWLRPMASDPTNPCQLRNIYLYLDKDSPPGSRPLIDEYVRPGNVRQLLLKIYDDEPVTGKERPVDEKLFRNI
jgi:hypothetical protein